MRKKRRGETSCTRKEHSSVMSKCMCEKKKMKMHNCLDEIGESITVISIGDMRQLHIPLDCHTVIKLSNSSIFSDYTKTSLRKNTVFY